MFNILQQHGQALEAYQKLLEKAMQEFENDSIEIVKIYFLMASVLRDLKKPTEALGFCEKALALNDKIDEEESSHIAKGYEVKGDILKDLKDLDQAFIAKNKALIIRLNLFEKILSKLLKAMKITEIYCKRWEIYRRLYKRTKKL